MAERSEHLRAYQREYQKEYQRKKHAKLKLEGICIKCCRELALQGIVYCAACQLYGKSPERKAKRDKRRADYAETGKCADCGKPRELMKFLKCEACREKQKARSVATRAALKDEVYAAYGGYKCKCCGYVGMKEAFQLDHINNDGAAQRKKYGYGCGGDFYRWLKKHGYPKDIQVLCANCNQIKNLCGGRCPCQEMKHHNEEIRDLWCSKEY